MLRSCLFQLGDDVLHYLLSWLDIDDIRRLDIATADFAEKLLWLKYLGVIEIKAISKHYRCHRSIRWLITRGTRTTSIQTDYSSGC